MLEYLYANVTYEEASKVRLGAGGARKKPTTGAPPQSKAKGKGGEAQLEPGEELKADAFEEDDEIVTRKPRKKGAQPSPLAPPLDYSEFFGVLLS